MGLATAYLMSPNNIFDTRSSADFDGPQDDDLVAYWNFDQETGDDLLDTIGENHAVSNGTSFYSDGAINGAREFSGWTSYISVPNSSTWDDWENLSLAFWLKPKGERVRRQIILNKGSFTILYNPSGDNIVFQVSDGDIKSSFMTPPNTFQDDEWAHLAVTLEILENENSIQFHVYKNGVEILSEEVQSVDNINVFNGEITFAKESREEISLWGALDEVYIYNSVISQEKVQEIYTQALK